MSFGTINDEAPLARRRTWALTPYLAYTASAAGFIATDAVEGAGEVVAAIVTVVFAVVALVSAYAVYSWREQWAHQPDEALDERERRARDKAYRMAYSQLATLGAVGLVGSQLAFDFVDDLSLTSISSVVVIGWFLFAFCLPSSILLWRERDLLGSDV
jgi:hypothetical protein